MWRALFNNKEIKFVYVVRKKVTVPTSVEIVDWREYSEDSNILSICESSSSVATNNVGLVLFATKLDTHICERPTNFVFMWLPNDEKLPNDVQERFSNMVQDLKAIVILPMQKKARRGFTPG